MKLIYFYLQIFLAIYGFIMFIASWFGYVNWNTVAGYVLITGMCYWLDSAITGMEEAERNE